MNLYMNPAMSIEQVRADALHGVSAARRVLAVHDPVVARAMGLGIEPSEQRVGIEAVKEFLVGQSKQETQRTKGQKTEQGKLWG